MDLQCRNKLLSLAVKMQEAMNELYAVMNQYPELSKGLDRTKIGDADYRIAVLTTHLIDLVVS